MVYPTLTVQSIIKRCNEDINAFRTEQNINSSSKH